MESFESFAIGSLAGVEGEDEAVRSISARLVTIGEGKMAGEKEWIEVNIWVPAAWLEVAGGGTSAVEQGVAAEVSGGAGVPAEVRWD